MAAPILDKRMRTNEDDVNEDRLSQLPITLLALILSFLPLRDAAATSILSKLWRKIWLFSDVLNFDAFKVFKHHDDMLNPNQLPRQMFEHVEWVRNVLQSHKEATDDGNGNPMLLKKLGIRMRINVFCQSMLDEWISYAFSRKVQSLELDFMVDSSPRLPVDNPCSFNGAFGKCLRSLSLAGVNVTENVIYSLLCSCKFLESLKVCKSNALKGIQFLGPSLALKHLEILYCRYLQYLIVQDTNLESLSVTWIEAIGLASNPKLAILRVSEWPARSTLCNVLGQLAECLSRVKILTLNTSYEDDYEALDRVPHLSGVKELTLIVNPLLEDSHHRYSALLSRSPNLEKLVLEFVFLCSYENTFEWDSVRIPLKRIKPSKKQLKPFNGALRFPRVKVLEVREYYGELMEDMTIRYILEQSLAPPEKIVFDPYNLGRRDMYPPASNPRHGAEMCVEKRAMRLKTYASSAEFVMM